MAELQDALYIAERALRPDHHQVATIVFNLANTYRSSGDDEAAVPQYVRALRIEDKAFAGAPPYADRIIVPLAEIYQAQRRHADAAQLRQRLSSEQ
ncbi:MAG: tetratricopeptide repeat protein [Proteobacteria bacterium]|nr:tetratricopeptide repeat protein [Pseudomonadota bacterium]